MVAQNDAHVTDKDWIHAFLQQEYPDDEFVEEVLKPLSAHLLDRLFPSHNSSLCYVGYQSALLGRRIHGHYYYRKNAGLATHPVDEYAREGHFAKLLAEFSLTKIMDWAIESRRPSLCYVFEFQHGGNSQTEKPIHLRLPEPWRGVVISKCTLTYTENTVPQIPTEISTLLDDWAQEERRDNKIQDYLKSLRPFFKSADGPDYRFLTLIPLWIGLMNHTLAMGTVWLQTQQALNDEHIRTALDLAVDWLAPIRIAEEKALTLRHAERAARAAIVARNLSHNIGSHVSPRATVENVIERINVWKCLLVDDSKESGFRASEELGVTKVLKTRLDDYLRKKGDFIAEITSEPLTSTKVAWFYADVVAPFVTNTLLMDAICRNETLGYRSITKNTLQVRVLLDGSETRGTFSCSSSEGVKYVYPDQYPYVSHCLHSDLFQPKEDLVTCGAKEHCLGRAEALLQLVNVDPRDIEVALPGPVGEYALYSFFENFLRNAAKHNRENLGEGLIVTLAVSDRENDSDFYELSVWDNVTNPKATVDFEGRKVCLQRKISELVKRDLIREDGRLRRGAWGLAEMKIAAALLGGDWRFARMDEALTVEGKTYDGKDRLVFKLKLMKPKRIYAVSCAQVADLEARGVIVRDTPESLITYLEQRTSPASAEFFVLDLFAAGKGSTALQDEQYERQLTQLLDQLHMLPFRFLCAIENGAKLPKAIADLEARRRLVVVREEPPWAGQPEELQRWAWRNWLRRWIGGEAQAQVNVFLDQGAEEEPTKSWKSRQGEHNRQSEQPRVTLKVLHKGATEDAPAPNDTGQTLQVFYDRHGGAVGSRKIDLGRDAYIWFDKLSPDFVRVFRKDPPALLPFQLVEAGLLRVLVIDERLAELAGRDPGLSHEDAAKLREILGLGDVSATAWHVAYGARVLVCTSLSWDGELYQGYTRADMCKLCEVTINSSDITCKCQIGSDTRRYSKSDIDVCIIHQGILDDLKCGPAKALELLQGLVPFVVVDSGRGIPPRLPRTQKFMPFSILNDWLGQRAGKLVLSQFLMQLTRRAEQFE